MAIIKEIQNQFPQIEFESFEAEHDPELCADIDYLGWVGNKALGIQIKLAKAKADIDDYSASERMKESFNSFSESYGGNVFIIFSLDGEIGNLEVIEQIEKEINRLQSLIKK